MKTVVITGGADGIGCGLARIRLERSGQVVVVGTAKAEAEPGAWFFRAELELVDENRRLINRLSAGLDSIDVLVLGARFQRSGRRETAGGLESNFALTCLRCFLLSHGLAGLLGGGADPVVLDFGGAGRFGRPRGEDLQQRTQYHGLTAMIRAGILNVALAVGFVGGHPAIRYVNTFPGTVATGFAVGDYDEAEAAQIGCLRAAGESVETVGKEILPFLDSGAPGRPVAVSEKSAVPLDPRASSLADARRFYDHTREVLAR